jgi:hypothetical protein
MQGKKVGMLYDWGTTVRGNESGCGYGESEGETRV